MEPEGILKACTTKPRMNSASNTAIAIASRYSLRVPFFLSTTGIELSTLSQDLRVQFGYVASVRLLRKRIAFTGISF